MTTDSLTHTDPKVDAVSALYDAYFRGDIDAAVTDLADNVDWAAEAASDSAPWYGKYEGKAVVPGFFAAIADNVDITEFTIVAITSNETDVVSIVHWSYTVKATGKSTTMYMQHWWRFENGRIAFFRGSEDTEQTAAAFTP